MHRKINLKPLCASVLLAEGVGLLSSFLSGSGKLAYNMLYQPKDAPAAWVFPVVWVILYALMGMSAYLVWDSRNVMTFFPHVSKLKWRGKLPTNKNFTLLLYLIQLGGNFFWSIFFFGFYWYLFSFLWTLLLIALVFLTLKQFLRINMLAGLLLAPYLLWLVYSAYLNFEFWLLNANF